eukprot:2627136-Rhodomonas_salina.1
MVRARVLPAASCARTARWWRSCSGRGCCACSAARPRLPGASTSQRTPSSSRAPRSAMGCVVVVGGGSGGGGGGVVVVVVPYV